MSSVSDYISRYGLDRRTLRVLVDHGHLGLSFAEALRMDGELGEATVNVPSSTATPVTESAPASREAVRSQSEETDASVPPPDRPSAPGNLPRITDVRAFAIPGKEIYHVMGCHHLNRAEVRRSGSMQRFWCCTCAVHPENGDHGRLCVRSPLMKDNYGIFHHTDDCSRLTFYGKAGVDNYARRCAQCVGLWVGVFTIYERLGEPCVETALTCLAILVCDGERTCA